MVLPNFKLQELPFLPRDRVVELVRPIDLISLSRCSKKWNTLVRMKKMGATYSFKITQEQAVIELTFRSGECLTWNNAQPCVISNGTDTVPSRNNPCERFPDRERGLQHCLHQFHCAYEPTFRIFRSLFPVIQAGHLLSDTMMCIVAEDFAQHFRLDNWKRITLTAGLMRFGRIHAPCQVLSGPGPVLLKSLKSETIWIEVDLSCYQDEKQFLTAKKLYIDNGRSITGQDLLNLDCEIASLRVFRSRYHAFNGFIHKWLRNEKNKLKYLHVCMRGYDRVIGDMHQVVLNSVPFRSWDGSRRARYYPLDPEIPLSESSENEGTRFDLKDGEDIWREDGTIATLIITNVYDVYLFVWHNRFPEQS